MSYLRWPFYHSSFSAQKCCKQCQLIGDGHGILNMMVSGTTPRQSLPRSPLHKILHKQSSSAAYFTLFIRMHSAASCFIMRTNRHQIYKYIGMLITLKKTFEFTCCYGICQVIAFTSYSLRGTNANLSSTSILRR